MPALAALASRPTPSCSSRSVTSCPSCARKYAAVTPTMPPPSTRILIRGSRRREYGAAGAAGKAAWRPRSEKPSSDHPAEQPRIGQDEAVVIDLDLTREVRVHGLVPVAPSRHEAGVALPIGHHGEVGQSDVHDQER